MAIGQRTATVDSKAVASTAHAVTIPTGLATGDVALIALATNGASVSAAPTGFTAIVSLTTPQNNPRLFLYRKVVTNAASETSWSFTLSTSVTSSSVSQAFTGVDQTTPEDVTAVTANGATGSNVMTVASVTTVTNGALLLYGMSVNSSASALTAPSGMTEVGEAPGGKKIELDAEARATAGATGTRAGAAASGTLAWYAFLVALRPATTTAATATATAQTVATTGTATTATAGQGATATATADAVPATGTTLAATAGTGATATTTTGVVAVVGTATTGTAEASVAASATTSAGVVTIAGTSAGASDRDAPSPVTRGWLGTDAPHATWNTPIILVAAWRDAAVLVAAWEET